MIGQPSGFDRRFGHIVLEATLNSANHAARKVSLKTYRAGNCLDLARGVTTVLPLTRAKGRARSASGGHREFHSR